MSKESSDEVDGPLGQASESVARRDGTEAETQTSDDASNGPETAQRWDDIHTFITWLLPSETDDPENGRTGPCSTYEECHAIFIGMMIGIAVPAGGLAQTVAGLLGAGALGSRYQRGIPQKYIQQAKDELPHFLAGIVIGYGAAHYALVGGIPL